MRNPRLERNIGLGFCLSGALAVVIAFQLPADALGGRARDLSVMYGLMCLVFGGGSAIVSHLNARGQVALQRDEGVVARWFVDAANWRAFRTVNDALNQEPGAYVNELSLRGGVSPEGAEVIVGKDAVQIDGDFHALPHRGTPRILQAGIRPGRPGLIELWLEYPGGGGGASGVPTPARRTALRFPMAEGAEQAVSAALAHYQAMVAESRSTPGLALINPVGTRRIAGIVFAACLVSCAAGMLLRHRLGTTALVMIVAGALVGIGAAIIGLAAELRIRGDRR